MAFLLWLAMPSGYPFSSIGRVLDMNTSPYKKKLWERTLAQTLVEAICVYVT